MKKNGFTVLKPGDYLLRRKMDILSYYNPDCVVRVRPVNKGGSRAKIIYLDDANQDKRWRNLPKDFFERTIFEKVVPISPKQLEAIKEVLACQLRAQLFKKMRLTSCGQIKTVQRHFQNKIRSVKNF